MRKTELKMNRMRKYQMLKNKNQQYEKEGQELHYKLEERKDGGHGWKPRGDIKRRIFINGLGESKEMEH
eukprot:16441743-Heterocapsa_arctica.AAC.1